MPNTSLIELRDIYFFLDDNFDDLKAACKTAEQKSALAQSYSEARDNFHRAVVLLFKEDDEQITKLTTDLRGLNNTLASMKNSLSNIAKVIQIITKAVDVGTKLVGAAKIV